MNNIHFITVLEFLLVGVIVFLQTKKALEVSKKIEHYKKAVPVKEVFKIIALHIPFTDLQETAPLKLLQNLKKYKPLQGDIAESSNTGIRENTVSLINPETVTDTVFDNILSAINVYLLKNKGATADFNLIKDITERNIEMEDEDISQTVTIPLYLGLMGTILGIIFGLINFLIGSSSANEFEIQGFLIGVSIAMFASVYGLFWTVINSNLKHKDARKIVEISKNNFYTFIQTELLPVLNQNISSSVHKLHTNLVQFNQNFTVNIHQLSKLLHKNYDAIKMQDAILQNLENIDIAAFAKANVSILSELKETTKDLSQFKEYTKVMSATAKDTAKLSGYFMSLLEKTDNFKGLAKKLDDRVGLSNQLVQFLNDHYQVLNERGFLINSSVKSVDDILIKSLDELQKHTTSKLRAIKEVTNREEDLMMRTFAENRSQLSNLSLLRDIKNNAEQLEQQMTSRLDRNEGVLKAILKELQTSNRRAEQNVWKRFKKWWLGENA